MENDVSGFSGFTVAVIGLGLMGGSFAARLTEKGHTVIGWNRTKAVAEEALARGLIASAAEEDIQKAELVIFCTPRRATKAFLENHLDWLRPGAVLTDISGVKDGFPEEINRFLAGRFDFISAHPMCGREGAGLAQADGAIFDGASYLITPVPGNTEDHIRLIEEMAKELGCHSARVTPACHDAGVAYTSDLTHVIATSLMNSASFNEHTKDFMGGSFRDETRVADINDKLWTSLFLENREQLLTEISRFEESLSEIKTALYNKDVDTMQQFLAQAAERRKELVQK